MRIATPVLYTLHCHNRMCKAAVNSFKLRWRGHRPHNLLATLRGAQRMAWCDSPMAWRPVRPPDSWSPYTNPHVCVTSDPLGVEQPGSAPTNRPKQGIPGIAYLASCPVTDRLSYPQWQGASQDGHCTSAPNASLSGSSEDVLRPSQAACHVRMRAAVQVSAFLVRSVS